MHSYENTPNRQLMGYFGNKMRAYHAYCFAPHQGVSHHLLRILIAYAGIVTG